MSEKKEKEKVVNKEKNSDVEFSEEISRVKEFYDSRL